MLKPEYSAERAMYNILYCNETIEELKNKNVDNIPDFNTCELIRILTEYRALLIEEMRRTPLEVFTIDDN